MKKLNVINLRSVSDVLSDKEMKNVMGGYGIYCACDWGDGLHTIGLCSGPTIPECNSYGCAGVGGTNLGCWFEL